MSRKVTAKRFSQAPSATLSKAAKAATPVRVEIAAPAVKAQEIVVVAPVAIKAAPVVETTVAATPIVEPAPAVVVATAPTEARTTPVLEAVLAIDSPDADTARDAATALGALGDKSTVDLLVDVLNNTNGYFHSVVRAAAASSLGQLGDSRAVEPLLAALTDPIAEVSSESIRALAALGDARAIDALIDVVRNRFGYFLPVTRQAAIFALAKLGGDLATAELHNVASSSWEEPAIRSAAEAGIVQGITTANI